MTVHKLKCWPDEYAEIVAGRKRHEIRKNDRDFAVGDTLHLCEYVPDKELTHWAMPPEGAHYTGREALVQVTCLTAGGEWGLPTGLVVMSISLTSPGPFYVGLAHQLPSDDERLPEFAQQRAERGFDATELWCLRSATAKWLVPRLRAFRPPSHPMDLTWEEWHAEIEAMQKSFEILAFDEDDDEQHEVVERGLDSFRKWFLHLWC
jgi:hypothetical protein